MGETPRVRLREMTTQQAIDYGFDFARHYFHGAMVALLSEKIDPEFPPSARKLTLTGASDGK